MNIVLIGATGFVGSALRNEALSRGHRITAVSRDAGKLPAHDGLTACSVDVADTQKLAEVARGADAVMSAFVGNRQGADPGGDIERGYASIVEAVKRSGAPRLLVVGGAGSLEVAPGQALSDQPGFPPEARAMANVLGKLREEKALDWTFLSPAAELSPGDRTGHFRLGGDRFLADAQGRSRISVQDYAVAMINELEQPEHTRRRFAVAY